MITGASGGRTAVFGAEPGGVDDAYRSKREGLGKGQMGSALLGITADFMFFDIVPIKSARAYITLVYIYIYIYIYI